MDDEAKLIEMRLLPVTLQRIDNVAEILGTPNRAQAVSASLQITHHLITQSLKGSKIILEKADGTKTQIKFKGITI